MLNKRFFVVNVYSQCDLASKIRLWDSLLEVKTGFDDGAWFIMRDFNVV